MRYKNTHRYLEVLPRIVSGYNATPHTRTGLPPKDVDATNTLKVFRNVYLNRGKKLIGKSVKYKFKEGDFVRISKEAGLFSRSFHKSYTEEIFVIDKLVRYGQYYVSVPAYKLRDIDDNSLERGLFYENELVRVHPTQINQ